MNQVVLMGRLTKDPEVRYVGGDTRLAIARYTLAVDRRFKRDGEPTADFINCVAFGKAGEFAEKYFRKGIRIAVNGRIQTGSYEGKNGKVYTTEVVVEGQEFAQDKSENGRPSEMTAAEVKANQYEWQNIPEGLDEELPFAE